MKTLCIIPARLQSTRLPQKMLLPIQGTPMIQKTYLGAKNCTDIDQLIVATDSQDIAASIKQIGGDVIMTPAELNTGSDRAAFAAKNFPEYDIVINLQGDEPFIHPNMLSELIAPYKAGETPKMATLAFPLKSQQELSDPNIVKVISDQQGICHLFFTLRDPLLPH